MLQVFGNGLELAVHAVLGRCFDQVAWDSCVKLIENGIKDHSGDHA